MSDQTVFHAFTVSYNGRANQLKSKATVFCKDGHMIEGDAIWDTGATMTNISYDVVKALNLIPAGKIDSFTPAGKKTANTYLVNISLPNHVTITDIVVVDSDIGLQGISVLIGMDIIGHGDFSVSNYGGKTTFTYRVPSKQTTDYVKQINAENIIGKPHGKGKRKHK